MPAAFIASTTVGGSVVGLSASFTAIGDALTSLHATATAQLTILDGASGGIRTAAIADFQAQVAAAVSLQANLGAQISDPSTYIAELGAALTQLQANLPSLTPSLSLSAQIGAAASLQAAGEAKIAAVDAQLSALASISAAISGVLTAAAGALSGYVSLSAKLGAVGAKVFLYTGTLAGLGAGIDAVSASSGFSGGTTVRVPIIVVDASNADAVAGVNAVFRTN